jgi:hypothetical protein
MNPVGLIVEAFATMTPAEIAVSMLGLPLGAYAARTVTLRIATAPARSQR